jgi:hypothetical protein
MTIPAKKNSLSAWLFNPFHFWGGSKGLWIGLAVLAIHIPVGYFFQARFDGAIDMHLGMVDDLLRPVTDVMIAWPAVFLTMYLTALAFKSPIRLIDIAGATAIARVPLLISVLPAIVFDPGIRDVNEFFNLRGSDLWMLSLGSVILLLFFIWHFVLLFNAYNINSNLKGWKLITGFILSVIIAEAISKVALIYV